EAGAHPRARLNPLAIGAGLAVFERLIGVGHGVERTRRFLAAPPAFPGLALGLAFLDTGAVRKEIFEQARCGLGHPHRPAPALGIEFWQEPGVIDMGVGEEQKVDRPWIKGGGFEIEVPNAFIALEQAAIDEELPAGMDDAIA